MKLDSNLISIFALAGLMFVAGSTITGGFWRRKLIKEEMKRIQVKQEQILLTIEERYVNALEHDEKILNQIRGTQQILQEISEKKAIVKEQQTALEEEMNELSQEIEKEKEDMKKKKDDFRIRIKD